MLDYSRPSQAPVLDHRAIDLPIAEWEAAFPGQQVQYGMPNRMRIAMHLARAMVRAAERGDIEVAIVYFDALHRLTAPQIGGHKQ